MKELDKFKNRDLKPKEEEQFLRKLVKNKHKFEQKAKWSEILAKEEQITRLQQKKTKRIKRVYLWVTAAAAAGILFFVIPPLLYQQESPKVLAHQLLEADIFPNPTIRKGLEEVSEVSELRQAAATVYGLANYPEAQKLYAQIIGTPEAILDDYLYLGLSQLYVGQVRLAISNLERALVLSEEKEGRFNQELNWFLALSYLKNDNFDKAQKFLDKIKPRDWKYEEAQSLLKRLD